MNTPVDTETSATPARASGLRKVVSTVIRIAVTVAIFWLLAMRIDVHRLGEALRGMSAGWLALSILAFAVAAAAPAVRWHSIQAAIGFSPRIATLLKIVFVGTFFNQVLPTGVGGDAVRAWRCNVAGTGLPAAVRGVLLDRASGYAVVVALYAAGLPELLAHTHDSAQRWVLLGVLAVTCGGFAALFLFDLVARPLLRWRLFRSLATLSRDARLVFSDRRRALVVTALSVVGIGLTIVGIQMAGRSVGIAMPLYRWMLVVPPAMLIQLLPVSLAGWGVREAAFVYFLSVFGVANEVALAASILVGIVQIVIALPGGLIWLTGWDIAGARAAKSDSNRGSWE